MPTKPSSQERRLRLRPSVKLMMCRSMTASAGRLPGRFRRFSFLPPRAATRGIGIGCIQLLKQSESITEMERGHPVRRRAQHRSDLLEISHGLVRATRPGGQDVRAPQYPQMMDVDLNNAASERW